MLTGSAASGILSDELVAPLPTNQRQQAAPVATVDPKRLVRELAPYRQASVGRSLFELGITVVPFLALTGFMFAAVERGYWLALLLVIPAAGFVLRMFLIQHDCGHDAFFPRRAANDWVGRMLGVFTFTPYDCWRRSHAMHHATAGNLDARGFGDIDTLTVREFKSRSPIRQLLYRAYRHPLVLLGVGPAYQFLIRHRWPVGEDQNTRLYWTSALATNATAAAILAALIATFGLVPVLVVQIPVILLAATMGIWLFYVQHQFEDTHWEADGQWSFHEAALHGSSHLDLPPVLRWFSADIGVHHVHHLASRIPFYRLQEVLKDRPDLVPLNRMTIADTFGTWRLTLWDEDQRQMVTFAAAAQR